MVVSQVYLTLLSSWDRGRFMKNFRFDTIHNITQEPQELYRDSIVSVGSSASLIR